MQIKNQQQVFDVATAQKKAESYCAYQERSHHEVRQKLYEWGVYASEVENIICHLIDENFLNEERFALAYVSGKFSIKKWGRIKIKQGLKQKKVSDNLIKKALKHIDERDYFDTLKAVLIKKRKDIKDNNSFIAKNKLANYALSRGFERDLIFYLLDDKELNIMKNIF